MLFLSLQHQILSIAYVKFFLRTESDLGYFTEATSKMAYLLQLKRIKDCRQKYVNDYRLNTNNATLQPKLNSEEDRYKIAILK
jgi:hypothetical protein